MNGSSQHAAMQQSNLPSHQSLSEFARCTPLRLSERERGLLNVLESTLNVSEYTDNVDVSMRKFNKTRRILDGILEACNIATGLASCGMQDSVSPSPSSSSFGGQRRQLAGKGAPNDNDCCGGTGALKKSRRPDGHGQDPDTTVAASENGSKHKHGDHGEARGIGNNNTNNTGALGSRDPKQNAAFFQEMFEVGRRNKVLNPSKMRATYGKLMYLLQDAQNPTVAKCLGFSLYKELVLVGPHLEEYHRGSDLLHDTRLSDATAYVDGSCSSGTGARLSRAEIEALIQRKQLATEELVREYSSPPPAYAAGGGPGVDEGDVTRENDLAESSLGGDGPVSMDVNGRSDGDNAANAADDLPVLQEDEIRRCIDSISDAVAVVQSNLKPVRRMLQLLEEKFDPSEPKKKVKYSNLQLTAHSRFSSSSRSSYYGFSGFSSFGGSAGGATLSHSHSTQYTFVWQSLRLWCEIQRNMHRLWVCADDDLLSTETSYSLWNTGQGLNRVQSCPRVGKIMRHLLHGTQRAANAPWVGLSVIHLGDRDVPNALVFIDKYTQVPRILQPIVDFVDSIDAMCASNAGIDRYVQKEFGGCENLTMMVLCDYFKHGFDGSGDDGGSCIDGRLTSSWNWTSRIAKKPYYHAFMLSGFQGFDGDFK